MANSGGSEQTVRVEIEYRDAARSVQVGTGRETVEVGAGRTVRVEDTAALSSDVDGLVCSLAGKS